MGLRAALRQDPDVIMIGEMRDAETVDTAIKAAETGHLLMSTLHTPDAQSTILRIMAMFPPEEQDVMRIRLAESLYAVVSQRLLPKRSGKGRAVAAEIMINTPAIKDLILEGTRIGEIRDYIAEGREQYGMQTFDQCLADLVPSGEVTFDVAKAAASNPSDFELKMRMFSRVSTSRRSSVAATPSDARPTPRRAPAPTTAGATACDRPATRRNAGRWTRFSFMTMTVNFTESSPRSSRRFDRGTASWTSRRSPRTSRAHLAAGLHGLVVTGSTGEAALLDAAERARARRRGARRSSRRDKVLIVGTGAESTRTCLQQTRDAARAARTRCSSWRRTTTARR